MIVGNFLHMTGLKHDPAHENPFNPKLIKKTVLLGMAFAIGHAYRFSLREKDYAFNLLG